MEEHHSIEGIATNGGPPEPEAIGGTATQLSLDIGGIEPTHSVLVVNKITVPVEGQFEKGDTVSFQITGTVRKVTVEDKLDKYGGLKAIERAHIVRDVSARQE